MAAGVGGGLCTTRIGELKAEKVRERGGGGETSKNIEDKYCQMKDMHMGLWVCEVERI